MPGSHVALLKVLIQSLKPGPQPKACPAYREPEKIGYAVKAIFSRRDAEKPMNNSSFAGYNPKIVVAADLKRFFA